MIIKNGIGGLNNKFCELAKTSIWRNNNSSSVNFINRVINNSGFIQFFNDRRIAKLLRESDLIFSNTITNGDILKKFNKYLNKKVVTYVHELLIATETFTNQDDLNEVFKHSQRYIVPSNAVSWHLVNNFGVKLNKIHRLNYFQESSCDRICQNGTGVFRVGVLGTFDWRKGADIFSLLVINYFKKFPDNNIEFLWKGVELSSIDIKRAQYELKLAGLIDKVKFEESSLEPKVFYESIDVLLSLSKEDPYPLVVLEAARKRIATICFENAGGAAEFVGFDSGITVPYLDLSMLIDSINSVFVDRDKLIYFGTNARNKHLRLHSNKALILEQFVDILKNF